MRIGIVGSGMIGATVGKLWADAGHEVRFSSRHPEQLQPLVKKVGAKASAGTPTEAVQFGEVILLAVPLKALPGLARDLAAGMKGKVILDASNAYTRRDGDLAAEATAHPRGSAGWAEAMFPGSRWVKAFNTVYFETLEKLAHKTTDPLGIPLAGDDAAAVETAAQLVRDAGFDPVVIGELARGRQLEPGNPPFNTDMKSRELRQVLKVK